MHRLGELNMYIDVQISRHSCETPCYFLSASLTRATTRADFWRTTLLIILGSSPPGGARDRPDPGIKFTDNTG